MIGESKNNQHENVFLLSKVVKTKVLLKGKKIGKLLDLIIINRDKVAEVTHLVISRPFGYPSLMVPWNNVSSFTQESITVDLDDIEKFACKIPERSILLKDYILDKKIIDLEETDVEIVYDIKIVMRKNILYITDVDPSTNALFRRLGLERIFNLIHKKRDKDENLLIPWFYVQALPHNIGSFTGDVKLNILKEKIKDLPPVNVVEIFNELDHKQKSSFINHLNAEYASDTLEGFSQNIHREIFSTLQKEKATI